MEKVKVLKNELKDWLLNEINLQLDMYEGIQEYGCDLGYKLFECANVDGTFSYSTYKAKEWIKEHFDDIGEVYEELKFQFGGDFKCNPFDEPEQFQVIVILEVANYMLSLCPTIEAFWNDKIELTKENIETIKKELIKYNNTYSVYV